MLYKILWIYCWYLIILFQICLLLAKTATSDDFNLRIMIYLLRILANIEIGDLYPVQSDTKIGAMLSRIKYIGTDITQNLEGKLSENVFIQYWDDIGQVRYNFMSL